MIKQFKKTLIRDIDPSNVLLNTRDIVLCDTITSESVSLILEKIIALDRLSKKPIRLYINSNGGETIAGMALVDIIQSIDTEVISIIAGAAISMAGIVSISCDRRYITKNSFWMTHEISAETPVDYLSVILDKTEWLKTERDLMNNILRTRTKLTKEDIDKIQNGQLWLNAEECVKKGIAEKIITNLEDIRG